MKKWSVTLLFFNASGYISSRQVDLGEQITMPTDATRVEVFSITTRPIVDQ